MSDGPLSISALDGHSFAATVDVDIVERPIAAFVQVAAWPDTVESLSATLRGAGLPVLPNPGHSDVSGPVSSLDAGPGAAYLTGPDPALAGRLMKFIPAEMGTVTDLSHARIRLRISGPRAAWILSKGIALDLHETVFPPGRCAMTQFHHIGILLHWIDGMAWDLYAYRGFARSLVHGLEVAGRPDRVAG